MEMANIVSDEFKRILKDSRAAALQTGSPEITSDHFLMATLMNESNDACEAIRRGGGDPATIRGHLADRYPTLRECFESSASVMLTDEAEQVVSESMLESEQWNSDEVTAQHIILAALKLEASRAGRTLVMYGLTYDKVAPERG